MALNPLPRAQDRGSKPEAPPSPWVGRAIEVGVLLLALALVFLIRLAWLEIAIVTSGSMEPTLRVDDRLLVDHRANLAGTWARGDIVVFEAPPKWSGAGEALIKRVVALPGQTVAMQAGKVLVDGAPLSEPYASAATPAANLPPEFFEMAPRKMEPGEYWVLGDNRGNSDDSRFNGPLPEASISGRVTRILLPWDRRRVVE